MARGPKAFAAPSDSDDLYRLTDFVSNTALANTLVGFTAVEDVFDGEVRFSSMGDARGLLNLDKLGKGLRFFGSRRDREMMPMVMGSLVDLEALVAEAKPKSIVDLLAPSDELPIPVMLERQPRRQSTHNDLMTGN